MSPSIQPLTSATFASTVLASAVPVLVDFSSASCPPCRMLEPVLARLAREQTDGLRIAAVDTVAEPELTERFGVSAVPTLILFMGGREVARHTGFAPFERVRRFALRLP